MSAVRRAGRLLVTVLAHRATLGVCAAILAFTAVYGRWQQSVADAENKCRSDIAGAFDIEAGGSLFRIEDGLVAVSQGDDAGLAASASRSKAAQERRDATLDRRKDAVAICAANPDFDPYEETP